MAPDEGTWSLQPTPSVASLIAQPLIVVVGLGGVGSHCALGLLRAGARKLRVVDFDRVSLSSLNRHAVATRADVGTSKVIACAEHFRRLAPGVEVDARDEMFVATSAGSLLGPSFDGVPVAMVIDCIDDINTKADLLQACVVEGLPVLSSLGSGAKGDPSRLCVARGLRDVTNDALGGKLRQVFRSRSFDDSAVTFVYSSEKAQLDLLPLSEDQRNAPEEFGNVAHFRLRVIPVLGTQPALTGLCLAAQAISTLVPEARFLPKPSPAPTQELVHKYLEKLRRDEAQRKGGRSVNVSLTMTDAIRAVNEVWGRRSAFDDRKGLGCPPGQKFALTAWDRSLPLSLTNVVFVTDKEAARHEESGSTEDLELRGRVEARLRWATSLLALPTGLPRNAPLRLKATASKRMNGDDALQEGYGAIARPVVYRCASVAEDADEAALLAEQLSRSSAFFGPVGQERVAASFVIILGAGGSGAAAAIMLGRSGVGRLRICERPGGRRTALRLAEEIKAVRPGCEVQCVAVEQASCLTAWLAPWTTVDATPPDFVVDTLHGVVSKAALLGACVRAGFKVVSAVGWAGYADPTRIAVRPLSGSYQSPAAAALRLELVAALGDDSAIAAIPMVLSEETAGWARPPANTLSTTPACFGFAAAAVALRCLSLVHPGPPPAADTSISLAGWRRIEQNLRRRERDEFGFRGDLVFDAFAVGFVVEELWSCRSAFSGAVPNGRADKGFCLTRWDRSRPAGLCNLVFLTEDEANSHDETTRATGTLPAEVLSATVATESLTRVQEVLKRLALHLEDASDDATESPLEKELDEEEAPAPPKAARAAAEPARLGTSEVASLSNPSVDVRTAAAFAALGALVASAVGGGAPSGRRVCALAAVTCVVVAAIARRRGSDRGQIDAFPWRPPQAPTPARGHGFSALVGATPLVEIGSLSKATGCRIIAKAEFLNPGGCQKDRVAKRILEEAQAAGKLQAGGVVVEGTSGSTGISLTLMAASMGLRSLVVMPDDQAKEKVELLRQFGAQVELVQPASIVSPDHYVNIARRRAAELEVAGHVGGAFFADQFENLANFRAHFHGTGPELWSQSQGDLDAFVMSAGTGGTLSGVGTYLKGRHPDIHVCLADVQGSSLYSKVVQGVLFAPEQAERTVRRHRRDTIAEGIGSDRLTANFAKGLQEHNGGEPCIDSAVRVTDQEALEMAHHLLRHDGLFVGSSAAVNCVAAVKVARRIGPGKTVATVLCDSGLRHLTKFYSPEAWKEYGLQPPSQLADRDAMDLSFVA